MTQITDICPLQKKSKISVDMIDVTTINFAGGNGTRLEPLTNTRCKPAVCFGGKYRLIDIPISNAIHLTNFAKETNADLVTAALPVNEEDAKRMGIMKVHPDYSVAEFHDKPQQQEHLNSLRLPLSTLEHRNSYIIGNDCYTSSTQSQSSNAPSIGENCIINHAIIDKNVHIGKNVHLINKDKLLNFSSDRI